MQQTALNIFVRVLNFILFGNQFMAWKRSLETYDYFGIVFFLMTLCFWGSWTFASQSQCYEPWKIIRDLFVRIFFALTMPIRMISQDREYILTMAGWKNLGRRFVEILFCGEVVAERWYRYNILYS